MSQTDPLTIRVLQAYDSLKNLGLVKNKREFAETAGFMQQYWTGFEKGTRKVSVAVANQIAKHFDLSINYLITGEGALFDGENNNSAPERKLIAPYDAHALKLVSEIPVLALPHVSFKARASFVELGGAGRDSGIFGRVLHRLPPGKTEADYADAIVFDIEGDSMEPSLRSGQQVIAWPVPEGRWEYIHNATCVVAYDDTVTVKRITDNDLFNNNRLTLRATGGSGGSFTVAREHIHSIWEVKEFYGTLPYNFYQ